MSSRVTIGIPFHNEEPFLDAAVRSVLAQSFEDFELLLVDDGSTDDSLAVARSFLRDERVRLFSDGKRRHLAARLNEIVGRARGELIARMDADDLMHPDKLRLQVAHLDREPSCDAVGTWVALIGDDHVAFAVGEAGKGTTSSRSVLEQPPIAHATMVARAAWLREYPYDETLTRAEDRDLWCRTVPRSRIDVLEDVLYLVHVSSSGPGFLPDYLRGQADLRRVLLRHGPSLAGPLPTVRLVGTSLLKSAAMMTLHRVGAAETVVSRRGRAPTARELARVDEALSAIR